MQGGTPLRSTSSSTGGGGGGEPKDSYSLWSAGISGTYHYTWQDMDFQTHCYLEHRRQKQEDSSEFGGSA